MTTLWAQQAGPSTASSTMETSPEFTFSTLSPRLDACWKLFDLCTLSLLSLGSGLWTGTEPHIMYWGSEEGTAGRIETLGMPVKAAGTCSLSIQLSARELTLWGIVGAGDEQFLSMKMPRVFIHQLSSNDQRLHSLSLWQAVPLPLGYTGQQRGRSSC